MKRGFQDESFNKQVVFFENTDILLYCHVPKEFPFVQIKSQLPQRYLQKEKTLQRLDLFLTFDFIIPFNFIILNTPDKTIKNVMCYLR